MTSKTFLIAAIVFFALLNSVGATDIVGNWIAHEPNVRGMTFDNVFLALEGELAETIFSFKVEGTKLTGTVTNLGGVTAINEGQIKDNEISFCVERSFEGNAMNLVYKGEVNLNDIKFIREVQGRMGQPQEFVAKREFQRNNGFVPFRSVAPVQSLPPKP
jgi:hypothetical protein